MKRILSNPENLILLFFSTIFLFWSWAFIYNSSFIAANGARFFCLFDDAMISMRYAWNFSHGLGLVWNAGEQVQGYSNLLMTLIMSIATLALKKTQAVLAVQVLGIFFVMATAFLSHKIAGRIFMDESIKKLTLLKRLSFICVLIYYPLSYWSLMGMETGLLTVLLLSGLWFGLDYVSKGKTRNLFWMSLFLGLAYLTRNDSLIFSFFIWLSILPKITSKELFSKELLNLALAVGLYFLFVVGQSVFQYLSYGEFLPNTYLLKLTGMPLDVRIKNGFGFITPFLLQTSPMLILSSFEIIFNFKKRKLALFSIVLSAIAYQIFTGGDPWAYWRIMTPTMPLLMILFNEALLNLLFAFSKTGFYQEYFNRRPIFPQKSTIAYLTIFCVLLSMLSVNSPFLSEITLISPPFDTAANQEQVNLALVLNKLTTANASAGFFRAGVAPYYLDRRVIDFLGKSDQHIARLSPDLTGAVGWGGMSSVPGHNKYDLNYSIKVLKPTYIQNYAWGQQNLEEWAIENYQKIKYRGLEILLLKNSPDVNWNRVKLP